MSDWKNSKEMDDNELENVSGGSGTIPKLYRCSVCGKTATQYYVEGTKPPMTIICYSCQMEGRGMSHMYPA